MRISTVLKGLLAIALAVIVTAFTILYSTDFNVYKGDIRDFVRDATGRDLIIEGDFKPIISMTPSVVVDRVRFSNAAWGTRKDMMRIETLRAELDLLPAFLGEIRIKQIVLSGADILLETQSDGTGNWIVRAPSQTKSAEPHKATAVPTFDKILIEKSQVVWRDGKTGQKRAFGINRFLAQAESAGDPLRLNLNGTYDAHPIELEGTFGSLNSITSGGAVPLDLILRVRGADVGVKGNIKRLIDGKDVLLDVSAAGKDLNALSGLFGMALPATGPYEVSATLMDEDDLWLLKGVKATVGGSDFTGNLSVNPVAKPVAIVANLTSSLFRSHDFRNRHVSKPIPTSEGVGPDSATVTKERIFPNDPLPLTSLQFADLKVSLRATRIEVPEAVFKDAAVTFTIQDGNLAARPVAFEFAGGRFALDLGLRSVDKVPQIEIKLDMEGLDLSEIVKQAGYPGRLTGRLNAKAALSGSGSSIRSIMATLNGTVELTMNDGRIDDSALDALSSDVIAAVAPWSPEDKGIQIKCLVGRYDIKGGSLTSKVTLFDTNKLLVEGSGGVDLKTEEIDFGVNPTAREIGPAKLLVPLKIGGRLASPTIYPDPGAIARGALGVATGIVTGQVITSVIGSLLSGSSDGDKAARCLAALSGTSETPPAEDKPVLPSESTGSPAKDVEKVIEGIGGGLKELLRR